MGIVSQLTQLGFTENQAKHLGIDGIDFSLGGWIPPTLITSTFEIIPFSPVYASVSSFTITGDVTSLIRRGDKLKFTNSGQKYAHVRSLSYSSGTGLTTINIVVNTDYTIANAAITDLYVSRLDAPYGFPSWFNWAPTLTGFSANPTNSVYRYAIGPGQTCTLAINQGTAGTSNTTGFQISLPITASGGTNYQWGCVPWSTTNNGAVQATPAQATIVSGGTTIILAQNINGAGGGWTAANGKAASLVITYEW